MTVIKQHNPDTGIWETILIGEKGDTGDTGAVGPQGIPGTTGATGSGLFIWGAWGGTSTPLPDPPDPWSDIVTQAGGLWLITAPIPTVAPPRQDATPARNGDGMFYDPDLAAWVNIGPIRGLPGVGAGGVGLPNGGTTGQVLVKNSDADYDVAWVDP